MARKKREANYNYNWHEYDKDCCQCHYNSSEMCPRKLTDIKWRQVCEHWSKKYDWRYEEEWKKEHAKRNNK